MITLTLALLAMAPATTNENFSGYFPTLCRAITSETWDQTGNLLLLYNKYRAASLGYAIPQIAYLSIPVCTNLFSSPFRLAEGEDSLSPQENLLHILIRDSRFKRLTYQVALSEARKSFPSRKLRERTPSVLKKEQ